MENFPLHKVMRCAFIKDTQNKKNITHAEMWKKWHNKDHKLNEKKVILAARFKRIQGEIYLGARMKMSRK
jgi:hypothetical protein